MSLIIVQYSCCRCIIFFFFFSKFLCDQCSLKACFFVALDELNRVMYFWIWSCCLADSWFSNFSLHQCMLEFQMSRPILSFPRLSWNPLGWVEPSFLIIGFSHSLMPTRPPLTVCVDVFFYMHCRFSCVFILLACSSMHMGRFVFLDAYVYSICAYICLYIFTFFRLLEYVYMWVS